jgi:hypothetical protein
MTNEEIETTLKHYNSAQRCSAQVERANLLWGRFNYEDKLLIAGKINNTEATISMLSKDEKYYVRATVAENPSTPAPILETLAKDGNYYVRQSVAKNPSTPAAILETLSKDEVWIVKCAVAENPSALATILKALSENDNYYVRRAARNNLNYKGKP